MTKLKAFIYCRVLDCKRKDVLYYQQEVLTKKAIEDGNVICSRMLVTGKAFNFNFYEMRMLLNHIRGERVDVIYIYDNTRITPVKELYMELEMLCDLHNVKIVCLKK